MAAESSGKEDKVESEFRASFKQFIASIEPEIKQIKSLAAAEDYLNHLEETDEKFHRYEFVKQLRQRINATFIPVVANEIEKQALSGEDFHNAVRIIIEDLLASKEYATLHQYIIESMKCVVNEMTQNFGATSKEEVWMDPGYSEYSGKYFSVEAIEEESSFSSSGKLSYMFMPHEKLRSIAQKLDTSRSIETRYQALLALSQIPPSDVVTSEHWCIIKQSISICLGDEHEKISSMSLKVVSRLHIINSGHVVREVFTCLTDHLVEMFKGNQYSQTQLDDGLKLSRKKDEIMIKKFRLLYEFMHEIPSYWIRYPERFVEDILESAISLLSLGSNYFELSSFNAVISPLHYLAILDPKASWFKKWMHGYYSRKFVVKQLKLHPHLVIDAIQHFMEFASISKSLLLFDTSDDIEIDEGEDFYSMEKLDYVYFVHSLCLIGRLLLYKDSRELFPVTLPNFDDDISTTDVVVAFIEIMSATYPKYPGSNHPSELVVTVLKEIASNSIASQELLSKDIVANTFLLPLQKYLEEITDEEGEFEESNRFTLLNIADVLACLAASDGGRRLLLYGENHERWRRNRFAPAHVIIEFTKKSLTDNLRGNVMLSPASVTAFLFVCRQLYNSCEGLLLVSHYGLHQCIANALTLPPNFVPDYQENFEENRILSKALIDNLLNFAGTPKGVLLLQQSGAMTECVYYMYERYRQKLQVSKCEKFGYGVMVTQISATCPGVIALRNSGYIESLLRDLWFCLEGGEDDNKILSPRMKENTIEKTLHKVMSNLLNVLSSFPAVYELFTDQPSSNLSPDNLSTSIDRYPYPTSIVEIIDWLALIDSERKVKLLLNYDDAHIFGLKLLNNICSSLDSFLLLQTQYNVQEVLLQLQAQSILSNSSNFVIDALSMARNNILVRTYFVGGPNERNLPPESLSNDSSEFSTIPMFSHYPPPSKYFHGELSTKSNIQDDDDVFQYFDWKDLHLSKEGLSKCHEIVSELLYKRKSVKGAVIGRLLEKLVVIQSENPEEAIFPLIDFSGSETILKDVTLSDIQILGTKLVTRYGNHLKLLNANTESDQSLIFLLKKVKCFLQGQQHRTFESDINFLSGSYPGFDWLASTIFLIMSGDGERCWNFLYKFSALVSSVYLWTPRLHVSVHLPASLMASGIPPIYSSVCHNIELVLQADVPLVFSAFRISGYTPSQICQHWLTQCFWNYLDWEDICAYIIICLAIGIDYQVYLCVAILRHLEREILLETQRISLVFFLKERPIIGFKVSDYMDYMTDLENRYRCIILKDLQNITKA